MGVYLSRILFDKKIENVNSFRVRNIFSFGGSIIFGHENSIHTCYLINKRIKKVARKLEFVAYMVHIIDDILTVIRALSIISFKSNSKNKVIMDR